MEFAFALIDPMVTYYREQYERMEQWYHVLKRVYRQQQQELYQLRNEYEELENWANDQEERANAMRAVINRMIDGNPRDVRRNLLEAFNEVARELQVDLSDEIDDDSDSEFSIGVMSDFEGDF